MSIDDIGAGVANRRFGAGEVIFTRGQEIPIDVLKRMPAANRNALIENRVISVYPKTVIMRSAGKNGKVAEPVKAAEMHVVARGFGKFDVICGTIEAQGLSREDAETFAEKAGAKTAPVNKDAQASEPASGNDAPKAVRAKGKRRKGSKRGKKPPKPAPGDEQQNGPIDN